MLQGDVVQSKKHMGNLPTVGKQGVRRQDRLNHKAQSRKMYIQSGSHEVLRFHSLIERHQRQSKKIQATLDMKKPRSIKDI